MLCLSLVKRNFMSKPFIEKTNTSISVFALIIAGLALYFSYYSYSKSKEERVSILVKQINDNYTTKVHSLDKFAVVPFFWEITISNNSDKTISIIDAGVKAKYYNNIISYSNMYNGVFTSFDKPVEMPINLISGESKKYFINIGILCDTVASSIIRNHFSSFDSDIDKQGKWIRINELKKLLSENGIDFYGNQASAQFDGEKILMYEVNPKQQQIFTLCFITSNKTEVKKDIKLYSQE